LLNEPLPANAQGRPNKGNNITFIPTEDNARGTSREYTVRRLKRDRPDLAAMVIGGAMSANAAAIEAGFRRRDTPVDTLRRAWGKASDDERAGRRRKLGQNTFGSEFVCTNSLPNVFCPRAQGDDGRIGFSRRRENHSAPARRETTLG